jgi:large subunit ribosomal protein L6
MSRIGRLPITVPAGVEVKVDGSVVSVKGSKGELSHTVASPIEVALDDSTLTVTRPNDERASRSLHGLTRTLISNMIQGVTAGYEKKLEIVGTGYRVQAKGSDLEFRSGLQPPRQRLGTERHHLCSRDPDQALCFRYLQAAGRRGCCQHSQAAEAGPL